INFTSGILSKIPKNVANSIQATISKFLHLADTMAKDNVAQSLSVASELPKTALEVPKIKVQLRAVNRIKNSNGVDSNSN
ncbi:hypothetical protein, partial [Staphylococcus aureus]|uniref:hypothetical protein n=1 Tax=Staphylococcus aureus TaxID=1280 RepID=UPI0038B3B712